MKHFAGIARLAMALATFTGPLTAQNAGAGRTWPPWRTSYFPYLTSSPNDGVMAVARLVTFRQAASDDRVSLRSAYSVEAGFSNRGSRLVRARADLPRIAEGWRLAGAFDAGWERHFGVASDSLERERISGWADVTRSLGGPLHFAVRLSGGQLNLEGDPTSITNRYPRSPYDGDGPVGPRLHIAQTDFQVRGALVLDLRDREFDTRQGALVEAGLFVGGAADGYTGGYALANGWMVPRDGTRLTGRVGLRAVSATQAADILHEVPAWEQPITVLGGARSHRALGVGEQVGRGVLMAAAEVRQDLMNFGNIGAVTLLGFVDAGRVFSDLSPLVDPAPGSTIEDGDLRLTLEGWTVGVGGGVAVRLLRNAQLSLTAARANGDTRWYVYSGWSW